jgi:hypothetical protein
VRGTVDEAFLRLSSPSARLEIRESCGNRRVTAHGAAGRECLRVGRLTELTANPVHELAVVGGVDVGHVQTLRGPHRLRRAEEPRRPVRLAKLGRSIGCVLEVLRDPQAVADTYEVVKALGDQRPGTSYVPATQGDAGEVSETRRDALEVPSHALEVQCTLQVPARGIQITFVHGDDREVVQDGRDPRSSLHPSAQGQRLIEEVVRPLELSA